ncbi:MAG: ABC transporter permease [Defluviitaleaceae bacterium]|nr:ABC transporter permease [Defluviitaleaceae bacterium]
MDLLVLFINAAVIAGTPYLFGTMGEILTEKSGNLNLGVEGMMFMGAIGGLLSVSLLESGLGVDVAPGLAVLLAVGVSFLAGAAGAFIYSVLVVTFRTQQNVTGLALTIFGVGLGNFLGDFFGRRSDTGIVRISARAGAGFSRLDIPVLSDIPYIGPLFFNYNILVYLGIAMAIVLALFFKYTRIGLNLRAVGENPAAADAASIPVAKYKYAATCIGGGICGIGGMYIIMVTTAGGVWIHNVVAGFGWTSVALVIFASWSPRRAILGSMIFGALRVMPFYFPANQLITVGFISFTMPNIPMQFYAMLPYAMTIFVLIFTSIRPNRETNPPGGLGVNYFREDR